MGIAPEIDPETGLPVEPDPNAPPQDPNAPTPPGAKKPPVPGNENTPPFAQKKAANDVAISDMSARIRNAITDASTPRTLYIYRSVLNFAEIAKHYSDQGVTDVITSEQHVTICYSKTAVDWLKIPTDYWGSTDDEGRSIVKPGGPRVMEKFGKYLVLAFSSSDLQYRHRQVLEHTGGSWDYEDYTPHVSISKNGAPDIAGLEPWTGPIILGPEMFEEIKPDYFENPNEDGKLTDSLRMVVDAIRAMPPPQVHVTVKNGRVIKEDIQIQHDERGRAIGATKTITEQPED